MDPARGARVEEAQTAHLLRELFEQLALPVFVKTTGSKGLHVISPLDGHATYDAKTSFGKKLIVQSKVEAVSQPPLANPGLVIGKSAEALTTLSPSGYVLVAGQRYDAFCRSGQVPKGTVLRVVGIDNFRIIVTLDQ